MIGADVDWMYGDIPYYEPWFVYAYQFDDVNYTDFNTSNTINLPEIVVATSNEIYSPNELIYGSYDSGRYADISSVPLYSSAPVTDSYAMNYFGAYGGYDPASLWYHNYSVVSNQSYSTKAEALNAILTNPAPGLISRTVCSPTISLLFFLLGMSHIL